MQKRNVLIRILAGMLVLCSLVLVGCSEDPVTTQPTTEKPTATTTPTSPTLTTEPVEDVGAAELTSVRQAMVGTPQLFAVAYLGITEDMTPCDPKEFMLENTPQLCADLPFLTAIPAENAVGQYGELYCIIPADPAATVAVNRGVQNGEDVQYTDTQYRSETGAPIVVFCNYAGFEPDTLVTITDSDGNVAQWYPQLNDYSCVDIPHNDDWEDTAMDITPYVEMLTRGYENCLQQGWEKPTAEDLIGTVWGTEQYLKDGAVFHCSITFEENTADLVWNTGYDIIDHEMVGVPWTLTDNNGTCVLTVELGALAGRLHYDVLLHREQTLLYTALSSTEGDPQSLMLPLMRVLSPSETTAELAGTWQMTRTEVEGDVNEVAPGVHTLTIVQESEDTYRISCKDTQFPDSNYSDKLLSIIQGETLYPGCGNDAWLGRIDHVGMGNTTYALTLLENGELLMQNRWTMDGSPMVSYAWFTRAD